MRSVTIRDVSSKDFVNGLCRHNRSRGKHNYKARLDGDRIVVEDEDGGRVEVSYGATADMRTCYARVHGVGIIGGWMYPHRRLPFRELVAYINRGIVYADMNDLPRSHRIKICPHCGGKLC